MRIIKRSAIAAAAVLIVAFGSSVGVGHATTHTEDFAAFNPLLSISVGDTVDFSSSCTDCGVGGDFLSLSETAPSIDSIAADVFVATVTHFLTHSQSPARMPTGSAPRRSFCRRL
jgi:hypothetical protein